MKSLKLLLLSIPISIFLSGCSVLVALASIADMPEKDWSKKVIFSELLNNPKKVLLTEDERDKAAEAICNFKHLKKYKDAGGNHKEKALKFCNLEKNSQIYFLKEITRKTGLVQTIYLELVDNKPVRYINIERKYSEELGRNVPIVERLH